MYVLFRKFWFFEFIIIVKEGALKRQHDRMRKRDFRELEKDSERFNEIIKKDTI